MFLIPWFFYLFLSCSISLLVNYDFILRYCGSFIVNFSQISANQSLSSEICSEIDRSLQSFFSETGLENYREIPAKSTVFSANLSLKIPRNLTFFRDLPEALTCLTVIFSYTAKESRNTGIILTIELKVIGNDELLNRAKTCYSTLLQSQDTQRGGWLTVW